MSKQQHPVLMCDGDDGMCGVVEFDHTLGGLCRLPDSETQLPPRWTGDAPGSLGDHHLCPSCSEAVDTPGEPSCVHCGVPVRDTGTSGGWIHQHGLYRCQSDYVAYGHLAHPGSVPCPADGPNPCLGSRS